MVTDKTVVQIQIVPSDSNQVSKCKLLQLIPTQLTQYSIFYNYNKTLNCVLVECTVPSHICAQILCSNSNVDVAM